jgi:hypothetical protein
VPKLIERTDQHLIGNNNFQPKDGEYHIVALNQFGNEKEGSDFSASPKLYEKYYSDPTKFKVKKNPNQY